MPRHQLLHAQVSRQCITTTSRKCFSHLMQCHMQGGMQEIGWTSLTLHAKRDWPTRLFQVTRPFIRAVQLANDNNKFDNCNGEDDITYSFSSMFTPLRYRCLTRDVCESLPLFRAVDIRVHSGIDIKLVVGHRKELCDRSIWTRWIAIKCAKRTRWIAIKCAKYNHTWSRPSSRFSSPSWVSSPRAKVMPLLKWIPSLEIHGIVCDVPAFVNDFIFQEQGDSVTPLFGGFSS